MGGGFLTIGYCSKQWTTVFSIVFWKFLWGGNALMEGDKIVKGGDPLTRENPDMLRNFNRRSP